jgi:hypothetical protein
VLDSEKWRPERDRLVMTSHLSGHLPT